MRLLSWALIFGQLGPARAGHHRRRHRRARSSGRPWRSRRLHRHRSPTGSSAVSICSDDCGVPTGRASASCSSSGVPIGLTMGFEGARVQCGRLSDGPVRRRHPSLRMQIALQIAAHDIHGPAGAWARRPPFASALPTGAGDRTGNRPRGMDGIRARHGLHDRHGRVDVPVPARRSSTCSSTGHSRPTRPSSRSVSRS